MLLAGCGTSGGTGSPSAQGSSSTATTSVVTVADEKKPHETLKERFDDFKADVDVHKAEHQEKDAIKDVYLKSPTLYFTINP